MVQSNRLSELRKEKGFSRRSFAKQIGIPSSTLRNYELSINEPRKEFWVSMSQYFNVSLDYLLCISDERSPYNRNASTDTEQKLLDKYRQLDQHGKELINMIIDLELLRCTSMPYHQSYVTVPCTSSN